MLLFNLCKRLAAKYKASGDTEKLEDLKVKIDVYYANDRLTKAQYQALAELLA